MFCIYQLLEETKDMNKNFEQINYRRCLIALIVSLLIVSISFVGIVKQLIVPMAEGVTLAGKDVFRFFTVLSALLIMFCATFCIPFEIQGLIKHNYHLPRWIVDLLYISTTCTTMTFMISASVIAPVSGIYETFFVGSLLYMHFLGPILALILFLVINNDHNIKKNRMIVSILPMAVYIIVYYYEVFILTESNGGWIDHYHISENIPVFVLFVIVVVTNLIVSYVLFKVHNNNQNKFKKDFNYYYMNCKEFEFNDINEAIRYLANKNKELYREGNIDIPIRIINVLKNRYNTDIADEELYKTYIETFVK